MEAKLGQKVSRLQIIFRQSQQFIYTFVHALNQELFFGNFKPLLAIILTEL